MHSCEYMTSTSERGRWCVLYARHQHEKKIAALLSRKGFEVFLPTYDAVHRWGDRKKRIASPLFPGYVFFVDEINRRLDILATPGVHAILTAGNSPAFISSEEMIALRRAIHSPFRVEPHPFLNAGDIVRIKRGPLEGLTGIVSRQKDIYRLVLSVEMLGRSAAVEIDASDIERVHSAATPAILASERTLVA
jgi:transcription antitermination factor NusG